MNLKEIIDAWKKAANPTVDERAVAERRMTICSSCPHRKSFAGIDVCGKCLCPIGKKVFARDGSCPDARW